MRRLAFLMTLVATMGAPAFSQNDVKAAFLKHMKISRDFTLKVAEQMPDADYGFKLTPPQMSFAEQMVHLAQGSEYFIAPILGQKPNPANPASMKKTDVIAFIKTSFDSAMDKVAKLTPEQLSKSYPSEEGTMTGMELLVGLLNHATHHRASAEMYLRGKGITPAEYQF